MTIDRRKFLSVMGAAALVAFAPSAFAQEPAATNAANFNNRSGAVVRTSTSVAPAAAIPYRDMTDATESAVQFASNVASADGGLVVALYGENSFYLYNTIQNIGPAAGVRGLVLHRHGSEARAELFADGSPLAKEGVVIDTPE